MLTTVSVKEMAISISKDNAAANHAPVLIVAAPGRRRDGLAALLKTWPRIQIVGQVDNSPAAWRMMRQHGPKLVLLDINLPDNQTWMLLSAIKAQHPEIRCLVLVDTIQQQQTAKSAGASAALLKGFAAAEFFAIVDKLLRLII